MKKYIFIPLILILLTLPAFAASNIQLIQIVPYDDTVSMSSVTVNNLDGWVTCPTVELAGRKEVAILNTSSDDDVYITAASGSTAFRYWTLYPRQWIKFRVVGGRKATDTTATHIYASTNTSGLILQIIEEK